MKILYFECFSGISGGMALSALMDLGVEPGYLIGELQKLNQPGWTLWTERVRRSGINANYARVVLDEPDKSSLDYSSIVSFLETSSISEQAKLLAKNIINRTRSSLRLDSVIEIVGCAVCIDYLNPDSIYSSAVNEGYGFTYDFVPVPSPTVAEIFSMRKVPFRCININSELVTPAGAAILSELAKGFGPIEEMSIEKTGYGAGRLNFSFPNVLRIYLAERQSEPQEDDVMILESNIDNTNPEILGYVMEMLMSAGARDVFYTNTMGRKNRPAVKLTVLCVINKVQTMEKIIFSETGAAGIMRRVEKRTIPDRKQAEVKTQYGNVKVRTSTYDGEIKIIPEYDDAKKIALKHNTPLYKIYEAVGDGELL